MRDSTGIKEWHIFFENHTYFLAFWWFLLNFSLFPTSTEKPEESIVFLGNVVLTTHRHLEVLMFFYKLVRETFSELTLTLVFVNEVFFFHFNIDLLCNLIKSYLCWDILPQPCDFYTMSYSGATWHVQNRMIHSFSWWNLGTSCLVRDFLHTFEFSVMLTCFYTFILFPAIDFSLSVWFVL